MGDADTFFWSLLFGAIGMGYFVYGKSQQNFVVLGIGAALCVFPYLVSGLIPTLLIGGVLTLLPWFIKTS